jgi:hypothetical protein
LSYWWSTVSDLFEPTDGQIKELKREYETYKQKENQNSTDYAEEMEIKANELRTLGLYYTSTQIGNQINENLLPEPKLFVFTNLMAQRIPCDLQSILKVLKTYDDTIMGKKASEGKGLVETSVTNVAESHGGHLKKNSGSEVSKKRRNKNYAKALAASASSENDVEALADGNKDKYISFNNALKNLRKYRKIIRKFKHTDNIAEDDGDADADADSDADANESSGSKAGYYKGRNALLAVAAKRTRSRSPSRFSDANCYKKARTRSPESRGRTVEYSRNARSRSRSRSPPNRGKNRSTYRSDTYGPKTSDYSSINYPNNSKKEGNPSQNKNYKEYGGHYKRW